MSLSKRLGMCRIHHPPDPRAVPFARVCLYSWKDAMVVGTHGTCTEVQRSILRKRRCRANLELELSERVRASIVICLCSDTCSQDCRHLGAQQTDARIP